MENKLQQLTQKLYDEGLEKGRAEAERLVSEAKSEAAKIIALNWNGASSSKVELQALLPEAERAKFDAAFAAAAKELLEAGIEVGYSKEVRTGFKVGAKGGSYYISFSDDDFEALLKEYLRGKISELLFKA